MRSTLICITAWMIAAIVQIILWARMPDKVILGGADLTHTAHVELVRHVIFVAFGLALPVAGLIAKRWGSILAIVSSLLYLVHWFPFSEVRQFGIGLVVHSMILVGSNPGLRLSAVTRDIVLPVLFLTVIVFAALELRHTSLFRRGSREGPAGK